MKRILLAVAMICMLMVTLQPLTLAAAGGSGFSFLKLGTSARGTAMADAMSGSVRGAAATFYNPAGLIHPGVDGSSTEFMFMHKEWIQDTRMEFLGARIELGSGEAIGVSVNTTTVSDIEIRTRPGTPEGTFTARNFALGLSYAQSLSDAFSAGLTARFIYEKILVDEASGFAFDLGLQYTTPMEGLSIGAMVANLGGVSELRNERTKLPAMLRVGPSYSTPIDDISSTLTVSADFNQVFPDNLSLLNVGGELQFQNVFAVRAGYQFGSEGRGFSTGVGVIYKIFSLDYAYAPLSSDLGNTHSIALTVSF